MAQPVQQVQGPSFAQSLAQPAPQQAPLPQGSSVAYTAGMSPGVMQGAGLAAQAPAQPATAPLTAASPQAAPQTVNPQPAAFQPLPSAEPAAPPQPTGQRAVTQPLPAPPAMAAPPAVARPEGNATGPLASLPPTAPADQGATHSGLTAVGALGKITGAVRGRRAARKPRLAMSAIFADLVDMADIPRTAYAVDEEITGAMCLFKTDGGYEVFSCAEDARHEVRFFEEEEAAYFYLFGVLAAEALRNGRLSPRRG
jgi:hypothetical protein